MAARSLYFTSPVGAHFTCGPEDRDRPFAESLDAVRSGRVKVEVKRRFRLDEARLAHEALQARATTGPIVLISMEVDRGAGGSSASYDATS